MTSATPKTKEKGRRRIVRFPGINADARTLGVHRVTLYRVLTGEFKHLKGLRRRYDELKAQSAEAAQ